jgi:cell wall assembly regulator SMI1
MENNYNTLMTEAEWLTDEDREIRKDYLGKVSTYSATQQKNENVKFVKKFLIGAISEYIPLAKMLDNDYSMSQFFAEYSAWYKKLLGSSIERDLNPGASSAQLDRLEQMVGYIDSDVRELYSLHNGCKRGNMYSMGLFGFEFMSIDEIIKNLNGMGRLQNAQNDIENKDGKIRANVFNYGWLPIMADSSGNFIGVDYYPTENGTVGQVINFGRDEQEQYVFAPSLKDFLKYLMGLTRNRGMFVCQKFDDMKVIGYKANKKSYMHLTEFLIALKNQQ